MTIALSALLRVEARGVRTTWLHSASPLSAEMVARLEWDCLVADTQHSMTGFGEMVRLLQATTNLGATVLVRPPALDAGLIGRLLDSTAARAASSIVVSRTIHVCCHAELCLRSRQHTLRRPIEVNSRTMDSPFDVARLLRQIVMTASLSRCCPMKPCQSVSDRSEER